MSEAAQEREFNLWLEVRLDGYGTAAQEEALAERVRSILSTRLHRDVVVSVVRDSDKVDAAVGGDGDEAFVRCSVCVRGRPIRVDGTLVYECVECGSFMNSPSGNPSGNPQVVPGRGTGLLARMRSAGWSGS